ncbi:hypothetical protein [Nocardia exalbida]|uniref:hypothetical protein n=1 Tax=Nocardia exalbida TaxID=290231 RepID=UPI0012F62A51|nr:hypothetical protein [Nocardia exalbida]
MSAPSPGTSTRLRLARITGLVLGSLVFLHACERSKSALLGDVRVEVAVAVALGAAALAAAWFEIKLRGLEQDADPPWDDAEQYETPSPGNFPGRTGRGADTAYSRGERARRPEAAARPAPMADLEDDDLLEAEESAGRADLVAGIARTLRITRLGASGERLPLPALNAMTKWIRRVDPDDEADPGELDDQDETEQITRTETGELVIESSRRTVRARIGRSGDLVVHGRWHGGAHPPSEWKWTFHPDAFHAIRRALGDGPGDLLDLLEDTIPWLDAGAREDPGAWLRAHAIPATYREKGVNAAQTTRELPVLQPGRPPQPPRAGKSLRKLPDDASGTGTARRSAKAADDDHARLSSGRERPPAAPRPSEQRSTPSAARPSSRRSGADRRSRDDVGQQNLRSDDHGSGARTPPARRRRGEPESAQRGDRWPGAEEPQVPTRPTPGRPDLPRRRHRELADDDQHVARQPDRYPDETDSPRSRPGRQSGRNLQPPTDFEPRTGRRDRAIPSERTPERTYDQPPPDRRHQRARRETPSPSHESPSRRGW